MVCKGLEVISPVGRTKCVVIIRENSGLGRDGYIRVIDMIKLQSIERIEECSCNPQVPGVSIYI